MAWWTYAGQFVSGLLLVNGLPHFVQGTSGRRFQSPFASPPGIGESSPLVNVVWRFANFVAGFALVRCFEPQGREEAAGWIAVGFGALLAGVALALHFGRLRGNAR